MAIQKTDGTVLTKTALLALTTEVPSTKVTANEDVYRTYNYPPYDGTQAGLANRFTTFEGERALLYAAGQVIDTTDIDLLYPTATAVSITPATGAAAGGTACVIRGTNLSGVTGVKFGTTAGTAFSVVGETEIHVTTPAHTAATVDVVVADDAGNVTMTGAFIFT